MYIRKSDQYDADVREITGMAYAEVEEKALEPVELKRVFHIQVSNFMPDWWYTTHIMAMQLRPGEWFGTLADQKEVKMFGPFRSAWGAAKVAFEYEFNLVRVMKGMR